MPAARYVVVDDETQTIVGGPYKWDGVRPWTPPEEGRLMLESEAIAAGYTYPPQGETATGKSTGKPADKGK